MLKVKLAVSLMAFLASAPAYARVFDLSSRYLGTYFGGAIGSSQLSRQPWGDSSGSTTSQEAVRINYSGEFGLLLATQKLNFRFGIEYLQPQGISEVKGKDASGNQVFTLDTSTRAFIPKAALELVVYKTRSSAFLFGGSIGYAMVSMENNYTIHDSASLGTTDFVEKASGTALSGEGFVGYEFTFSDNVTVLASVGYRYLVANSLKYQNEPTLIGGTTVSKGDLVRKSNDQARSLNLSSTNAGLLFRFYF